MDFVKVLKITICKNEGFENERLSDKRHVKNEGFENMIVHFVKETSEAEAPTS